MKFYFSYGFEDQPYVGGWTEVEAPDFNAACHAFRAVHPNREDSKCLNCASIYTEKDFPERYRELGNLGAKCHEKITLTVEVLNK